LVVAFALAGTVDIDLIKDPLGISQEGNPVFLKDIWPSSQEIMDAINQNVSPDMFKSQYANVYSSNETWNEIAGKDSDVYQWDDYSTYIQEPPFFQEITSEVPEISPIKNARVLALFKDSITTDHISPAGAIPVESPAGKHLIEKGVQVRDFNSFGSRRGNDRIMTRGTFGNIRLKNQLLPGVEGGYTVYLGDQPAEVIGQKMSIFDAAEHYKGAGIPLIILAGKEYGTGSSRDWAAKGTLLLGVKAVIAESFERIHRSNLVGMGVLPLQFKNGLSVENLGLDGTEVYNIIGMDGSLSHHSELTVKAKRSDGTSINFQVIVRIDTVVEVEYYRNGGILQTVLRNMM
jgi:aconitate hydratase